jgi:5-methylcytosine-specific restriction endonuclease McrA
MPANGRWPYADPRWPPTRRLVLARDGWACVICRRGRQHGTILDVDHIINADVDPDLAFDPINLRTLCRLHHNRKTHGKGRTKRRNSRRW